MILISIIILIVVIALFFNAKFDASQSPISIKGQSFILYNRISSIVLLYSGALAFNAFYIQSIGSGIGIYSVLFSKIKNLTYFYCRIFYIKTQIFFFIFIFLLI